MNSVLAGLFTSAMQLSGQQRLALMLPLCLSIAIVYKTIRCERLGEVPAGWRSCGSRLFRGWRWLVSGFGRSFHFSCSVFNER